MSKYTTEVRYICENIYGDSSDYTRVNNVIEQALPKIFDFDFPIFDEVYREVLEKKIIKHYYTREIGFETVALWKLKLDTKLNEIMPYYNKLYESELLNINPLYTVDLTTTRKTDGVNDSTNNATSTETGTREKTDTTEFDNNATVSSEKNTESKTESEDTTALMGTENTTANTNETGESDTTTTTNKSDNSTDKYSDTPQGSITDLANDNYLTNARMVNSSGNETTTASNNYSTENESVIGTSTNNTTTGSSNSNTDGKEVLSSEENKSGSSRITGSENNVVDKNSSNVGKVVSTEDYLEHVIGYSGNASEMLIKFRKTFLNIDMMIIEDLSDLFMLLW